MTSTTVLSQETKAAAQALLTRCFRNARGLDHVLMREPQRDEDGTLRSYSWDETEALDELATLLGIDSLDVSAPVAAEERKAA